jgi:hypothetical protein
MQRQIYISITKTGIMKIRWENCLFSLTNSVPKASGSVRKNFACDFKNGDKFNYKFAKTNFDFNDSQAS